MYFLLKMGIFHCYVSLPEGTSSEPFVQEIAERILLMFCDGSSHENNTEEGLPTENLSSGC